MFQKVFLFSKLPLLVSTWAVIALCFTASQLQAFPTSTSDPSAPPGTSPTSSSTLNNFGSDWRFKCTKPKLLAETPVEIFCEVNYNPGGTLPPKDFPIVSVTGRVFGGEVLGTGFVENRTAVWDMNIQITGVVREYGPIISDTEDGSTWRTVTYSANLDDPGVTVSGSYILNVAETKKAALTPTKKIGTEEPDPNTPWVINVGAPTADSASAFPGGKVLGQQLQENQVLHYQEVHTFLGNRETYYFEQIVDPPDPDNPTAPRDLIPTPNAGQVADILDHLGLTGILNISDAKPLFFEPDERWQTDGSAVALIGLDGANQNTLGIRQDDLDGPRDTPLIGPYFGENFICTEIKEGVLLDGDVINTSKPFIWYLKSSDGESADQFFSDPTLNPDSLASGSDIDHMITYDLAALDGEKVTINFVEPSSGSGFGCPSPQSGVEVELVRPKLITWEDLFGGGDSDFDDASYLITGINSLGASGGTFAIVNFCHSSSLLADGVPACTKPDPDNPGQTLSTTGSFQSVSLPTPSACQPGDPTTGTVEVDSGFSEVTIVSTNLGCKSDAPLEEFIPVGFAGDPLIDGQTVDIFANSKVVSRELTGFGVGSASDGTGFKSLLLRRFINGTEELHFKIEPPAPGDDLANRFISVGAEFFVGWNLTQFVKIQGLLNGVPIGDPEIVEATSLPDKLITERIVVTFSEPVDEIVFSAGEGGPLHGSSIYGLRDPAFGTVVEALDP